jgi:hypothetical protein
MTMGVDNIDRLQLQFTDNCQKLVLFSAGIDDDCLSAFFTGKNIAEYLILS